DDCQPWLQQGDVFEHVPWFRPTLTDDGTPTSLRESGAALLITESCQLDKRTNSGKIRPGLRLQFLPLGDVSELNHDSQTRLLGREDNPPEAIYAGEADGRHIYGR